MLKLRRVLVVAAVCFCFETSAAAVDYGDITVTVDPPPGSRSHGYVDYKVVVSNRASQASHQVTLTIPGNSYSGSGIARVSRSVLVQPSSTLVVSLPVPALPLYGSGLGVSIDGKRQDLLIPLDFVDYGGSQPHVLVSSNVDSKGLDAYSGSVAPSTPWLTREFTVVSSPIAEWSENWLGYSGFDCVVASGEDLRAMPPGVRSAIWRYVECGGLLVVSGNCEIPEPWRSRYQERAQMPTWFVGFGQCILVEHGVAKLVSTEYDYIHQASQESMAPFGFATTHEPAQANRIFPIVENLTMPVRGLFLLMLVFVAVIGPLNLFVLARKKRKIWLLWTVPAISLITCVAVSAYSIFSEGWGGRSRTAGITILDEQNNRATTIGWTAFYTPLTPSDGLHYGYETEVTPQLGQAGGYRGEAISARSIDWTGDQHLSSGWVSARVPAHFKLRKSELRRERLTLSTAKDGSLELVNGLGANVRELWLADRDGQIHNAGNVLAGASVSLVPRQGLKAFGRVDSLHEFFATAEWTGLDRLSESLLMPGCYIAVLESNPFIEEGLRDAGQRKSESVVYGIMKRE
ncbi:MAG TPA: hypothetical protein VG778_03440 [Blastocatellia bacterium]|nr:hypothetical protein [Blastocatellia bacterium]